MKIFADEIAPMVAGRLFDLRGRLLQSCATPLHSDLRSLSANYGASILLFFRLRKIPNHQTPVAELTNWIYLLIAYDVIFTSVAFMVFDAIVEE
ncbi:MAG: hypothetical protein HGB14_10365 [Anaerolineaceae bacterium]|nr:hypothetical protein [Anaerolineaceae bacterium]